MKYIIIVISLFSFSKLNGQSISMNDILSTLCGKNYFRSLNISDSTLHLWVSSDVEGKLINNSYVTSLCFDSVSVYSQRNKEFDKDLYTMMKNNESTSHLMGRLLIDSIMDCKVLFRMNFWKPEIISKNRIRFVLSSVANFLYDPVSKKVELTDKLYSSWYPPR